MRNRRIATAFLSCFIVLVPVLPAFASDAGPEQEPIQVVPDLSRNKQTKSEPAQQSSASENDPANSQNVPTTPLLNAAPGMPSAEDNTIRMPPQSNPPSESQSPPAFSPDGADASIDSSNQQFSDSIRPPFNLGVKKSVIDTSIDEQNNNLQGGAGVDSQFPGFNLNANSNTLKGGANTGGGNNKLSGGLTQAQLDRLANHDLVLIIDQSGSMRTPDCPMAGMGRVGGTFMTVLLGSAGAVSRWEWCRVQTVKLAEQTRYVNAKGLSVVLFSGNYFIFPHVTLNQIPVIFNRGFPGGGTNLTDPLRATISDYFRRKATPGVAVKPLAISIITDGLPNNPQGVKQAIVEATYYMKDPRELSITFFLIGNNAYQGQSFAFDLEKNLVASGGKYNIVKAVSFWNMMKVGLPRALADALE